MASGLEGQRQQSPELQLLGRNDGSGRAAQGRPRGSVPPDILSPGDVSLGPLEARGGTPFRSPGRQCPSDATERRELDTLMSRLCLSQRNLRCNQKAGQARGGGVSRDHQPAHKAVCGSTGLGSIDRNAFLLLLPGFEEKGEQSRGSGEEKTVAG